MADFQLCSPFQPTGDQPQAIDRLVEGVRQGVPAQTLMGVTGSGKTFTIANVIARLNRPALILSHNKTLAAQLYAEMKAFFPHNAVEYFVSYYDYYQPEAYIPSTDTYIEKDIAVNEEIDRLRLHAVSALLSGRRDVIIVASVSCLYGLGSPQDFSRNCFSVTRGDNLRMDALLKRLVEAQYVRNDAELSRGRFRVRGDTVDIALAYSDEVVRIEFFGTEVDRITVRDNALPRPACEREEEFAAINIYPATIFTTSPERIASAMEQIRLDLAGRVMYFEERGEHLYAKRIEERVRYDLEMIQELGYCSGVENYSRYFDGRAAGSPPYCLLDYFPSDSLFVVDESHVTVPQLRAMYGGDRSRKENLVRYGFRLPAACDNRPLKFAEWEERVRQGSVVYMSATPDDYELEQSCGVVVEQLIRPTGLLDPTVEVRPTRNQVDDLLEEIHGCVSKGERVLVTTLTKRMAEELDDYLRRSGIRSAYIHSGIDTIGRVRVLDGLRSGEFDVLVGVNLLREGLDIPEVSLVAVMDSDKEGFLRDYRSILQMSGRCARHVGGRVLLYGDRVTCSMERVMLESERRRAIQLSYNAVHHITPTSVGKSLDTSSLLCFNGKVGVELDGHLSGAIGSSCDLSSWHQSDALKLEKAIQEKRRQMLAAAKQEDFQTAALLRDEMLLMEDRLQALS